MKLRAEIEVRENASWQEIEDAKLAAPWHVVLTVDDRMRNTNLEGKCGTCKHFVPRPDLFAKCYGNCLMGRKGYKQRSCKGCKAYERKKEND